MGMTSYIVAIICVGLIVWSRKVKARKQRAKFKRALQGYKFASLKELKAHWRGRMDIGFGNDFDPNYHGNLLETLRIIDEKVTIEWVRWNS